MAATTESEIITELEHTDEKMKLRIREIADFSRGSAVSEKNRELLFEARNHLQAAISTLLRIKW